MGCHRAPEFDMDPRSLNNGIIGVFGNKVETDESVTRAPTLRDVFGANGQLNGSLMHDASKTSMIEAIAHYNSIDATGNNNLDPRLRGGPGQNGQQLGLTQAEMEALEAFMKTLTGSDVYLNEKWADPFVNN